jgi:hypothetical protein
MTSSKNNTTTSFDMAMMTPCILLGMFLHRLFLYTVGAFMIGWIISRDGPKK